MPYADDWNDGTNTEFVVRVAIALLKLAFANIDNADADPLVAERRQRMSKFIIDRTQPAAQRIALLITAQSAEGPGSTDTAIQAVVDANVVKISQIFDKTIQGVTGEGTTV